MKSKGNRTFGYAPLKHVRTVDPRFEEEPNTPSKSKGLPRRPHGACAAGLLFLLVSGFVMYQYDFGSNRSESYYRRALISRMYSSNHRQRKVAAGFEAPVVPELIFVEEDSQPLEQGDARQREALEIADDILLHHAAGGSASASKQPGLEHLSAGGGEVSTQAILQIEEGPPFTEQARAAAEQQRRQQQQQQQQQQGGGSATPTRTVRRRGPATVVITHVTASGARRELVVDAARVADLDSMSQGLESQDLEAAQGAQGGWWSREGGADPEQQGGGRARALGDGPSVALATAQLTAEATEGEEEGEGDDQCKIYVLDVNNEIGSKLGARRCDLSSRRTWPFSRAGSGIDGADALAPEHYQYAVEHWIAQAIRNSSRHETDMARADFVFVDMWCYHTAWLSYIHPWGNRNTSNPEPYMRRGLDAVIKMDRFVKSKGADFGLVHPNPVMQGLFSEETLCEDLASVYSMVLERSSLCVWTQGSAEAGKSAIIPYVATLDLDLEGDVAGAKRDIFAFFRGGCGHPDASIRGLFAAGKMLRYELVSALRALEAPDLQAECSCDICDNRMPHEEAMAAYRRTRFCPILPSNVQSSRRLSEAVLAGCIPVFIGPPFHSLPLAHDIDYAAMAVFINVSDTSPWINRSSPNHLQNHMVNKVWKLDDAAAAAGMVTVPTLEDAIQYLRDMPPEEEEAKRQAVLQQRLKFYYGAVPEALGGDGHTSELGELLMRRMCRRAAIVKRRLAAAAKEGLDVADSEVKVELGHYHRKQRPEQQQQQGKGKGWFAFRT